MGCDIHLHVEQRDDDRWGEVSGEWYDGRNYELFALIADVRNKGGITPIAQPRGLPDDVSTAVRTECDYWGIDGHSHSWLFAHELVAYDWSARHKDSALIWDEYSDGRRGRAQDIADFATKWGEFPWTWRGEGVSRCQGAFGLNADKYARVTWEETAASMVGPSWLLLVLQLARLDRDKPTRIVFWFDN